MSRRSSRVSKLVVAPVTSMHDDEEMDEESDLFKSEEEEKEETQSEDMEEKARTAAGKKKSKVSKTSTGKRAKVTQPKEAGGQGQAAAKKKGSKSKQPTKPSVSAPPDADEIKELFAMLSGDASTIGREQVEEMAIKLGLDYEEEMLETMMSYAAEGGEGPSTSSKRPRPSISLDQFQNICSLIYSFKAS